MILHKLQCVEVAGPEVSALRDKMRKVLLSKEAAGVRDEYPKDWIPTVLLRRSS